MRSIAGVALGFSAVFLIFVAVMLNSGALFYMGTATIATILACRLQAWLSVRGLRFERIAPPSASVGDQVTVEMIAWSDHPIKRPLITVVDALPSSLPWSDRSPSLPIAPAYNQPIRTQYAFRPLRRGRYRWDGLTAIGTDALGLVRMAKTYKAEPAEMLVLPLVVPVHLDLPRPAGWGVAEADGGKSRGTGIDPRGVREYSPGDSLRHIHWRSTARTGQLLVKEFDTGAYGRACFFLQRTVGSDLGKVGSSSLDLMCGHAAFIAQSFLKQGTEVLFPALEEGSRPRRSHQRAAELLRLLAEVGADQHQTLGDDLLRSADSLTPGTVAYAMLTVADPQLIAAAQTLREARVHMVALLYDSEAYSGPGIRHKVWSATNPDYLTQLRVAGVEVRIMPTRRAS